MNLFYVLKLNTSYIMQNGGYIKTDFRTARENGLIISLGDNQMLKFIREINDKPFKKEKLEALFVEKNRLKQISESKENSKKISLVQNRINDMLFVSDLVSIKVDTSKKDYKQICKEGFIVSIKINGKIYETKYKRLCAGAGQLRRNCVFFVNEKIYDALDMIMMNGLTKNKVGKINLAKWSAYYSLYSSATNQVRTPRICVIKDYEYTLKDQKISWIFDNDKGEKDIEERTLDIEQNAFDGSGIVSPEMALKWQEDLSLDFLPSSFILRGPFVKGLVSVFDFKRFAKEIAHTDKIKDLWGVEYSVDKIDVILTASQFKLY